MLIPLIIGLLGLGFNAKVTVVFLGAVVPILLNTYVGVLNADGELVDDFIGGHGGDSVGLVGGEG